MPESKPKVALSTKIYLVSSFNLLVLGLLFVLFARGQFRLDINSFLRSPVQDHVLAVARQVALEVREAEPSEWNILLEKYSKLHDVEFWLVGPHGSQLAGPARPLPAEIAGQLVPNGRRDRRVRGDEAPLVYLGSTRNPSLYWVGARVPVPLPGYRRAQSGMLVASAESLRGGLFAFDPKPWLAIGGAAIVLSALCWLPLVRGLNKSVRGMTAATAQIAEGRFDVQLPVSRRDELGLLSASINRMASRLAGLVKGQKRFLGDTAHELCSPIARMQVALGILERSAGKNQAPVVADLREDVQHMSALVSELLAFSRAEIRPTEVKLEAVDVADITARVLSREAGEGGRVSTSIAPGLLVLADRDLLSRALSNLVRNALRYAGAAGPIGISAEQEDGRVHIRVSDAGPGLAEEDLEAVFDPFYRPAPARERDTGGAGLGLAIVKTCVHACRGTVRCRNRQPSGLEVRITLQAAASGAGLPA